MGGKAAERDISLKSGRAVAAALCRAQVDARACDVRSIEDLQGIAEHYDRAFIALHGRWGEDGTVQAVLDDLKLPYTGSGMAASAIAMDKLRSKWLWRGAGLPTPDFLWASEYRPFDIERFSIEFPVIVKPCHEGSSIGMRKVSSAQELAQAMAFAQTYDTEILVERWVQGREFTVGILDGEALPLIELRTSHAFYDFEAKYQSNDTQYLCPCDLPDPLQAEIQQLALQAFEVVGAEGWGRVDVMLDENNRPWLIELNSVPGMTDHSLVPMAAKACGLTFEQLVVKILSSTLK
jgi:D-alanine-D-alanine ligase